MFYQNHCLGHKVLVVELFKMVGCFPVSLWNPQMISGIPKSYNSCIVNYQFPLTEEWMHLIFLVLLKVLPKCESPSVVFSKIVSRIVTKISPQILLSYSMAECPNFKQNLMHIQYEYDEHNTQAHSMATPCWLINSRRECLFRHSEIATDKLQSSWDI